jgi:peptidoglycan/xylan/chitin deacetylase (PgdA/CDA1 family)
VTFRRGQIFLLSLLLVSAGFVQPQPTTHTAPHPMARLLAVAGMFPNVPSHMRVPHRSKPPQTARLVLAASTSSRLVALTFDLDMTPQMAAARRGAIWINRDALGYLESTNTHATIFMTGMWADMYPSLAQQLASNPNFELGNHSYSHPAFHSPCYRLASVGSALQAQQVALAQRAIQRTTGVTPRYFRFPGGCYDRQALDLVHAAGLVPIEWDVNSIDAFNSHAYQIATTVLSRVKPGSIVVMHLQGGANAPATGAALRLIIPVLQARGYRLVTISELLAAGPAITPTDPREVVEFSQPSTAAPVPRAAPPRPHWCGWVQTPNGPRYICR